MELPNIGQQCSFTNCKQLDFLPLQCKCGEVYCSQHFKLHVEKCVSSKFLTKDELNKIKNVFVCSYTDCDERSIIPFLCDKCKKHFCIKHRHLVECDKHDVESLSKGKEKYAEPLRRFTEAKTAVDKQLETTLNAAKNKPKNKALASKVQLMKIKNKATGIKTIPVPNRIYFNITKIDDQLESTVPIFVSNQWSVGRTIDAIAEEMKLPNYNNKSDKKKLRLFTNNKEILSKDLSMAMSLLLEKNVIIDGDSLIIEYVDDDCFQL